MARGLTGAEVGVAAEERGDIYVMSLRSRRVDLNQFLRDFAKRYGVSGGGHPTPPARGCRSACLKRWWRSLTAWPEAPSPRRR